MVRRLANLAAWLGAIAMMAGAPLAAGCASGQAQAEATPTPIPTPIIPVKPTYEVRRGEVIRKLEFNGRVEPVRQEELSFRRSGHVSRLFVQVYDSVTEGQILAELVIDDLEREMASAELELARAQASLEAAERDREYDVKRAGVEVELAQLALEAARSRDLEPLRVQAQADLKKAEIALREAQGAYDRVAWRNDLEASAEAAALEQATLDYEKAKADHQLALQAIAEQPTESAILERQVELAELALQELQEGVDPILRSDVTRAQARADDLKAEIAEAQLVAPFDGQILSNYLSEGYEVQPFKIAMLVADPSALEVRSEPETLQLQEMKEGMAVAMTQVNSPGQVIDGHILRLPSIYGSGDRTDLAAKEDETAHIALDDPPEAGYDLGDLMRVSVIVERRDDALWLPPQAIRTFEGRKFVVVKDGEAQRRVDVQLGLVGEDRVEIEEGLAVGQVVISP